MNGLEIGPQRIRREAREEREVERAQVLPQQFGEVSFPQLITPQDFQT